MAPLPDDQWFRVEVADHAGQIVAIEPEMLAGRDIGDKERETLSKAVLHLCGFAGLCQHGLVPRDCMWCDNTPTASDFL